MRERVASELYVRLLYGSRLSCSLELPQRAEYVSQALACPLVSGGRPDLLELARERSPRACRVAKRAHHLQPHRRALHVADRLDGSCRRALVRQRHSDQAEARVRRVVPHCGRGKMVWGDGERGTREAKVRAHLGAVEAWRPRRRACSAAPPRAGSVRARRGSAPSERSCRAARRRRGGPAPWAGRSSAGCPSHRSGASPTTRPATSSCEAYRATSRAEVELQVATAAACKQPGHPHDHCGA